MWVDSIKASCCLNLMDTTPREITLTCYRKEKNLLPGQSSHTDYIREFKGDIAIRRGFSLITSGNEGQISEITIFKSLLDIPVLRCLNNKGKENLCSWLLITGR